MLKFKVSMVVAPPKAVFEAVAKQPLENALKVLSSMGYDGVELSVLEPEMYRGIERILTNYGLEVSALSTGLNYLHYGLSLSSPDPVKRKGAVKRLIEIAEFGEKVEAGVIVGLMRGKLEKGQNRVEAYEHMINGLKEVCRGAREHGVDIFFEPLNRYETQLVNTVAEGLKVLEDVNEDNLFLLLDTFHMNIEEPVIEDSIRQASDRIGHFHVADSNRLAPGMGHLDFTSILAALKDTGYKGYLSAEIIVKPDLETAAMVTLNTLKKAMELL